MADKSHWLGTATDLLNAINDTATPPNTVTKLLNKFSIDLYFSDGIDVHFRRTNRKKISSSIVIGAVKNENSVTDLLTVQE